MKKIIVIFICILFGTLAACAPRPPARPTHVVPQLRLMVHADTAFTNRERFLILKSAENIRRQTNDFLAYSIVFDLDFSSMQSLKANVGENTIVRIHSSAEGLDSNTLGYCNVSMEDLDLNNPSKIALVHDRLTNDDVMVHVAMHEMLHMARLQHIGTVHSIMYPTTPVVGHVILCMTKADFIELCTVHGCDVDAMVQCEEN